jgi:hypothetical protein
LTKVIDKNIEAYTKYEGQHKEKPVVAYVMLRSMEGKLRAMNAYKDGAFKRWFLINCCCKEKIYKKKYFFEEWLQIKSAKAPDIINWENLGSTKTGRFFRITMTTIFSLVLIVSTFILLLVAQYYQKELQNYSPQIDCPENQVTQGMAYEDQI